MRRNIHIDVRHCASDENMAERWEVQCSVDGGGFATRYVCYDQMRAEDSARVFAAGVRFASPEDTIIRTTSMGYSL